MTKTDRVEHELQRLDDKGGETNGITTDQAFRVIVAMQRQGLATTAAQ